MKNYVYIIASLAILFVTACGKEELFDEDKIVSFTATMVDTLKYNNLKVLPINVAIKRTGGAPQGKFHVKFEPASTANFVGVNNPVLANSDDFKDLEIAYIRKLEPGVYKGTVTVQQAEVEGAVAQTKDVVLLVTPDCEYNYRNYKNATITYSGAAPTSKVVSCKYDLDQTLSIVGIIPNQILYLDINCASSDVYMLPYLSNDKVFTAIDGTISGDRIRFKLQKSGVTIATVDVGP